MFNSIKISKLLEKTNEQLEGATECLKEAMCTDNADIFKVALTNAFTIFEDWSSYYKKYTEFIDDEKEQSELLVKTISNLEKQLNDKDKQINQLQSLADNLNSIIKSYHENDDTRIELAETRDALQLALNTINENAKVIAQTKKVKSKGELAPAFNTEVHTEDIIKAYQLGETPNQIAQKCGMTQSAIIYRLKQAGVYISKGKPGRPEK